MRTNIVARISMTTEITTRDFRLLMCQTVIALLLVVAWASNILGQATRDESAKIELATHCAEFASLLANPRVDPIECLIWPEALVMSATGHSAENLVGLLITLAQNKDTPNPFAGVRVLERTIQQYPNVAIVTELLCATVDIDFGSKVTPRRRMTTWMLKDGSWKVCGLHVSEYTRWEPSIVQLENEDVVTTSSLGTIVFLGSSSIRRWNTLAEDFAGHSVLRRGFGGSQLIDCTMYVHRIVSPYRPAAVAVYAGDNDIGKGKSADRVLHDFCMLVEAIHGFDAQIEIGFIAIKPSPKRWELWSEANAANQMVDAFAKNHPHVTFLDIATPMLGADGRPKPEYFVEDDLHMTAAGYKVWTEVITPWVRAVEVRQSRNDAQRP